MKINKSIFYALYLTSVSMLINVSRAQAAEENATDVAETEIAKEKEDQGVNGSRMFISYQFGATYGDMSFSNNFDCKMPLNDLCGAIERNVNGEFDMSGWGPAHNFGLGFAKKNFRVMVNLSPGFTSDFKVSGNSSGTRWLDGSTTPIRYSSYLLSTDYLFLFENSYVNLGPVIGLTVIDTFGYTSNTLGLQLGYTYEIDDIMLSANVRAMKLLGDNSGNLLPTFGINTNLEFWNSQIMFGIGYIFSR